MSAVLAPPRQIRRQPEPLENGESVSAPEFLRRYEAMTHVKKAELIEGIVYMPSPVRTDVHAEPDNLIQTWLGLYAAETPGVRAGANATVLLDSENVPQPDAVLRLTEECGGSSRINEKSYLCGAPELVVEIAASSGSIDLHDKLRAHRRNGVKEYLVWRTTEEAFDWFVLVEGTYRPNQPDAKGILHSITFPGLALHASALLARDGATVLSALQAGLRSKMHKTFVARLAACRTANPARRR
jgi:Uma2 family endonuclease